jgi:hypothetical protein
MNTYTPSQKKAIYNWVSKNREKFRTYCNKVQAQYYTDNKEMILIKKKKRERFQKEAKRLMNILI